MSRAEVHLPVVGKPRRIDEMQFLQSELGAGGVHVVDERFDGSRNPLRDRHRDVVGRLDHQQLEGVVEISCTPG